VKDLTPPVECGLLGGVSAVHLLATRRRSESACSFRKTCAQADQVYLANACGAAARHQLLVICLSGARAVSDFVCRIVAPLLMNLFQCGISARSCSISVDQNPEPAAVALAETRSGCHHEAVWRPEYAAEPGRADPEGGFRFHAV